MTEAEKAAAAKAAAEAKTKSDAEAAAKKAADDKAAADDDEEEDPPADDKADKPISRAEFEAFKKKANKEAEKHRLGKKTAEDALDTFRKGISGALGIKEGTTTTVDAAATASTEKQKRLLVRSEFVGLAAAAGAISAGDAFELARPYLKDVAVDLENESVDAEALVDAVEALKKAKPFLFKAEGAQNDSGDDADGVKRPAKKPDGSGKPAAGGTDYEKWQALVKSGRNAEAATFYGKNKAGIKATWK